MAESREHRLSFPAQRASENAAATAKTNRGIELWSAAYALHLVLLLLLLLDVLHAQRLGMAKTSDRMLGALAAVWLLVATVALLAAANREQFIERVRGPLLSFYAVLFSLALIEVGLRTAQPDLAPAVWRPGMHLVFRPDPEVFSGTSDPVHFSVNGFGLRGPSLPPGKAVYEAIALGGSTTLCLMLDDGKTWPGQLMKEMNDRQHARPVWVSNAGVNGHTAAHHLMMLRSLPILHEADLVLILAGINDFQYALALEGASTQALVQKFADQFRNYMRLGAESAFPLYRRLRIYELFHGAMNATSGRTSSAHQQETWNEKELRKVRASKPVIPMPDLTIGLAEYRQRLQAVGAECAELGVRCLFLTQPSMWRPDLPSRLQGLLLFGWIGPMFDPKGFASLSDLEAGLDQYNQVMLDVCKDSHLECFDLAAALPKDDSVFYDDVHFNKSGARQVAHVLSNYLLSRPPFTLRTGSSQVQAVSPN